MRWSIFWHCDTFSCFKNHTLPMTTFNYQSVFSVVGHAGQKAIVLLSPQLHNTNGVMRTDYQERREQAENRGKESPTYPRATVGHSFQWGNIHSQVIQKIERVWKLCIIKTDVENVFSEWNIGWWIHQKTTPIHFVHVPSVRTFVRVPAFITRGQENKAKFIYSILFVWI